MQEDQREQGLKQEEAKGKKSKLPVIIGLTAAVIVVAAAGAFAALRLFASNPKVAVAKAFVSLLGDPQKSPMEELFGISQMQKNALTGDFQEEFEVSLTGISDEDLSILEGAELNGQGQVSRTDDQYYGSVGLVYKGLHLGQLEAYYAPGEMLQAAIPDFSSRVFQIELGEELEDQIYQWFLWDEIETTQEEKEAFAQYFSEQLNGLTQEELSFSQLWSRFSESASAVAEFTEAVQAEKAGKETFQMDGKEVSCTGYEVVIEKKALAKLITDFTDFVLEDEEFKEQFMGQVSLSYDLYDGDMGTPDEGYETFANEVREAAALAGDALDDVHMMVYVDKKGRMAAWDMDTSIEVEDTTTDISLKLRPQGGVYLTQNMTGVLELENKEGAVVVEMERTGMFENGLLEDQIDVTAAVDGEELRFGYQSSYDSGDQTWQISMDLGMADEAEAFLLKAEGEVEDLEKGSGISVVMDDLTLSFDGAQVNLEGSYSYGPLEESIESLEGDPLNVFTATEADWTAVGEEISKKFQSLQFTVIMQTGL